MSNHGYLSTPLFYFVPVPLSPEGKQTSHPGFFSLFLSGNGTSEAPWSLDLDDDNDVTNDAIRLFATVEEAMTVANGDPMSPTDNGLGYNLDLSDLMIA